MVDITGLPNEVLSMIFEYLAYNELKFNVPLACKHSHDVIQVRRKTGIIDQILFRDEATQPVSSCYQLHPAFNMLRSASTCDPALSQFTPTADRLIIVRVPVAPYGHTVREIDVYLDDHRAEIMNSFTLDSGKPLSRLNFATENAVSPVTNKVWISCKENHQNPVPQRIRRWDESAGRKQSSTRVEDVIAEIATRLSALCIMESGFLEYAENDASEEERSGKEPKAANYGRPYFLSADPGLGLQIWKREMELFIFQLGLNRWEGLYNRTMNEKYE